MEADQLHVSLGWQIVAQKAQLLSLTLMNFCFHTAKDLIVLGKDRWMIQDVLKAQFHLVARSSVRDFS